MLDLDALSGQPLIVLFLLFTQLIGRSFFYPLSLVWHIQLFTFIQVFKSLKACIQPYSLLLKPIDGGRKAILQQFVVMLTACITLTDIQDAPVFVGQAQRL